MLKPWSLLIGVISGAGFAALQSWQPWQSLEASLQSQLFRLRGSQSPHPELVILAIDNSSQNLGDLFVPEELTVNPTLEAMSLWPWPRSVFGSALEQLAAAGARAVVFDLIFSDPSVYGDADDQAFAAAIARYPEIPIFGQTQTESIQFLASGARVVSRQTSRLLPTYAALEPRIGLVNLPIAAHGQVLQIAPSETPPLAVVASEVPLNETLGINFRGAQATYPVIPFWQIFEPTFWQQNLGNGAVFANTIVLIGDTTAIGQDLWPTPFDPLMPGVEIHANAIDTLLSQTGLRPLPGARLWLVAITLGFGLLLWPVRGVLPKLALTAAVLAVIAVGGYGLFLQAWTAPLAGAIAAIASSGLAATTLEGMQAQQNRLRLRRILERRVAPAVLAEILQQPAAFADTLGGQVRTVAILFSDLRDFTPLAASLSPEALVTLLNRYFEAMAQPILAEQGTIDKFIGDAIMAVFGAPLVHEPRYEALAAIKAALGMRQALTDLRQALAAENQPPLFQGIGINVGDVVAGNIGAAQRLDYTVIGDAVNVASRVESLCKTVGRDIVITESVYRLVRDRVEVEDLGLHALKGKAEPMHVYGVVGWLDGESTTAIDR